MKETYAESGDEVASMIGDTNLFILGEAEAEAEIMIAEESARGQRLGWESLLLMMRYGLDVLKITTFQAKIKKENLVSLKMFERIGFKEISRSEVFGEITVEKKVENEFQDWLYENTNWTIERSSN